MIVSAYLSRSERSEEDMNAFWEELRECFDSLDAMMNKVVNEDIIREHKVSCVNEIEKS